MRPPFAAADLPRLARQTAQFTVMPAYEITSDVGRFDTDAIHAFLSRSYWSPGVPRAVVERAIENSLCFGVLLGTAQVGFGRVITDRATFAYLADVYVLEEHRGKGLSKRLMDAVVAHPTFKACGACCLPRRTPTRCTPSTASNRWRPRSG
jgi:ribosomal protein S18 acetylase RimI-like enzyme